MTSDQKKVFKRWLMAAATGVLSGVFAGFMFNLGTGIVAATIVFAIILLATSPPPPELL